MNDQAFELVLGCKTCTEPESYIRPYDTNIEHEANGSMMGEICHFLISLPRRQAKKENIAGRTCDMTLRQHFTETTSALSRGTEGGGQCTKLSEWFWQLRRPTGNGSGEKERERGRGVQTKLSTLLVTLAYLSLQLSLSE